MGHIYLLNWVNRMGQINIVQMKYYNHSDNFNTRAAEVSVMEQFVLVRPSHSLTHLLSTCHFSFPLSQIHQIKNTQDLDPDFSFSS